MNLHEYQARGLLRDAGIPVPDGDVATTPDEVEAIAKRLGTTVVVKAQVHAGGRGKAGGVKLAKDAAEARAHEEAILGMKIKGLTVEKVLVVPAVDIASESYVGVIVDRASERAVMMVSPRTRRGVMLKVGGRLSSPFIAASTHNLRQDSLFRNTRIGEVPTFTGG